MGCLHKKPDYDMSRSLLRYDDNAKSIIFNFKYNDKTYLSNFFVKMMIAKYSSLIEDVDIITYVPMHKFKRIFRLYNQAWVLANAVAKASNKKLRPNLIIKKRNTKSQTTLSKTLRKTNLIDNFEVRTRLDGLKILLIDDVITTGSTVNYCAKALKKQGAQKVYILSIAKTY
ncbi:MAG: ComF family protein [Rickettsiaceae bacterium]|nr:ComF family protein [Rickettsiaceae bacterium]